MKKKKRRVVLTMKKGSVENVSCSVKRRVRIYELWHYAPQLAQVILQSKTNISLKGILIGNPLLDFDIDFNSRAEFLWFHGLIADSTYQRFTKVCNYSRIRREARRGNTSVICDEVYQEVTTTERDLISPVNNSIVSFKHEEWNTDWWK
ncbi:serine carboxypeptidase [Trifolium repens]|nr:serine carboxypeptidase [Trifolium repens]